jgi:hypothetical protein
MMGSLSEAFEEWDWLRVFAVPVPILRPVLLFAQHTDLFLELGHDPALGKVNRGHRHI